MDKEAAWSIEEILMTESEPIRGSYAAAGVNIDLKAKVIAKIGRQVLSTYRPEVLSGVGPFGGLYEF